jgi:hypothetical protein
MSNDGLFRDRKVYDGYVVRASYVVILGSEATPETYKHSTFLRIEENHGI